KAHKPPSLTVGGVFPRFCSSKCLQNTRRLSNFFSAGTVRPRFRLAAGGASPNASAGTQSATPREVARMLRVGPYVFKHAETRQEFENIHRLNYRTFVSEIPQYSDPGTGRLVDKFHDKSAYFIVLREGRVVGMLSAHDQPPFSVADRLLEPEILTRPG